MEKMEKDKDSETVPPHDGNTNELKEWDPPELMVEDINQVTGGGQLSFRSPGDDVWYSS